MTAHGESNPLPVQELTRRIAQSLLDPFWIPSDVVVLRQPGLVVLGCPRPLNNINVCMRLDSSASTLSVQRLVDVAIEHMHADNHAFVMADPFVDTAATAELTRRGYVAGPRYEARFISVNAELGAPNVEIVRVDSRAQLVQHYETLTRAFEVTADAWRAEVDDQVANALDPNGRVHRFLAQIDHRPVATAGLYYFPNLELVELWGGGTIRDARGRGAYRALLAHRLRFAKGLGARWAALYAKHDSSAPIVDSLGFARGGSAHFWKPRP